MTKKEQLKIKTRKVIRNIRTKIKTLLSNFWHSETYSFRNAIVNFFFISISYLTRIFKYIWFTILVLFSYIALVTILQISLNKTMLRNFDYIIYPISGLIIICVLISMWDVIMKYLGNESKKK